MGDGFWVRVPSCDKHIGNKKSCFIIFFQSTMHKLRSLGIAQLIKDKCTNSYPLALSSVSYLLETDLTT